MTVHDQLSWRRNSETSYYYRLYNKTNSPTEKSVTHYLNEVDAWMKRNKCGVWQHKYMIKFNNEIEATMFLLRWQ